MRLMIHIDNIDPNFDYRQIAQTDRNFDTLRDDPQFQALLAEPNADS